MSLVKLTANCLLCEVREAARTRSGCNPPNRCGEIRSAPFATTFARITSASCAAASRTSHNKRICKILKSRTSSDLELHKSARTLPASVQNRNRQTNIKMKDIIDKISSYNIFNYLFPGVLFVIIAKRLTDYNFVLNPAFCQYYVLVAQLKYTKICIKIGYFVNLNMQGKKNFTPQLFVSVNLLDLVPEDNFYRKLLMELDFIKMVFIDFKSSFLSTPIFSILTVN